MIAVEKIEALVKEKIADSDLFLVNIKVSGGNQIVVLVDSFSGILIEDCIGISKHVEGNLDREVEDFEIEVSSAGLEAPFVVEEQYKKALGKEVKVITEEGKKVEGTLAKVNKKSILLKYEEKQRLEGRKKKVIVPIERELFFDGESKESNIKTTKIVISFK